MEIVYGFITAVVAGIAGGALKYMRDSAKSLKTDMAFYEQEYGRRMQTMVDLFEAYKIQSNAEIEKLRLEIERLTEQLLSKIIIVNGGD